MRQTFKIATVALGIWIAMPALAGAAPLVSTQAFGSCADARGAGFSDMQVDNPGYSTGLDRDQDGIACGSGDTTATPTAAATPDPAAAAPPAVAAPTVDAAPLAPSAEVLGEQATAEAQPELAYTGTATWVLAGVAIALMLVGYYTVKAGYYRLDWMTGRKYSEVRYTVERDRRRRPRR